MLLISNTIASLRRYFIVILVGGTEVFGKPDLALIGATKVVGAAFVMKAIVGGAPAPFLL